METMEDLVIGHSKKKLNGTWAGIEMLGIKDMEEEKRNSIANHYIQALIIIKEQRERLEYLEMVKQDYLKVTNKIDEIIRLLEKK